MAALLWPDGEVAPAQTLHVQNLAPDARREVTAIVVPFPPGAVPELPAAHVKDTVTVWQPFGARWPDGSLRQALCLFAVELPGLGERELELVKGRGPRPLQTEIAMPDAELAVVCRTKDGTTARAVPRYVRWLEDNALRRVALCRARLEGTPLVAELIVAQGRGDPHAYVDIAVFCSDPTTTAMQVEISELAVESRRMALLLRHPGRLGVSQRLAGGGSRAVLLQDRVLGDGMGLRRSGALVPPLQGDRGLRDQTARAAATCPLLAATSWVKSGAFGAFGEPAAMPPWLQGNALRAMLARRHSAFIAGDKPGGDPLGEPWFGPARNPGQTGDQRDFGIVKLSPVAVGGLPSMLLEVEASVLQEACRPVHFFEPDGRMVKALDHPDWIVWSGRAHWHAGVSPDRLGKPHPEPRFERSGWGGKDRQHWSTNYLGAYALLTGAHWARRQLQHEVQLYLSGQTVRPDKSTSGAGAPRGAGRVLLAASWLYLATGDPALLERIDERIDKVYHPQWPGRTLPEDAVRTMQIAPPDQRMLAGKTHYWTPWQDAIAACGFAAAHRITGNPRARELAEELALSVVRHGFKLDERECIIATAMRWQDGEPLRGAQLDDPDCVLWSHGTAFSEWAIGAVEIARVAAEERGDQETAERARQIQQRVRAGRQRPGDGYIDRLSEWDAVRWQPGRVR